jgi:prepilin-type N-terminal cleavage/methylation domain-containing protein
MLNKLKNKRNNQNGFTIIEVLIVLAIAGLILLVVFLAVPALQRNAHNTTKKSDVASLLGGMTEYATNNSGALPAPQGAGGAGPKYTIGVASGGAAGINAVDVKLGNYDGTGVSIVNTAPPAAPTAPAVDSVVIYEKATCQGNIPTATGATARSFAAFYQLEGGATQCSSS